MNMNYLLIITVFAQASLFSSTDEKSNAAKSSQAHIKSDVLSVETNDKKIIQIPKELIPIFGLVTKAIEADSDAKQIPLPSVDSAGFNTIVNLLYDAKRHTRNNRKQIEDRVAQAINSKNINGIYRVAEYLDVSKQNDLFKALAKKYAQLIYNNIELLTKGQRPERDVIAQAKSLVNAKYYLPQIANQYFLLYEEDIDNKLGTTSKPTIQELIDYGFLTDSFVKNFTNLENDPNEIVGDSTPWGLAIHFKLPIKSIKALLKRGTKPDLADITYYPKESQLTIARMFVKAGAPIDGGPDSVPPLIVAIRTNNYELVKYLLSLGANVNIKRYSNSPLTEAKDARDAESGRAYPKEKVLEMMDLLKKYGAKE